MTTGDKNQLILEFLGRKGNVDEDLFTFPELSGLISDTWVLISEVRFDNSWNWLMIVVERITQLPHTKRFDIGFPSSSLVYDNSETHSYRFNETRYCYGKESYTINKDRKDSGYWFDTNLEAVYELTVSFIIYYNKIKTK
tara:strand:- start:709 stop:1128 length:420 start_codon:yes stop_codon:yes gene_type:complete